MFGLEFIALKTIVDLVEGLRYKLQMMGVPVDGLGHILCDIESVVTNSTTLKSPFKTRHISIAYHIVFKAQEAGTSIRIAHISGEQKHCRLISKLLNGNNLNLYLEVFNFVFVERYVCEILHD